MKPAFLSLCLAAALLATGRAPAEAQQPGLLSKTLVEQSQALAERLDKREARPDLALPSATLDELAYALDAYLMNPGQAKSLLEDEQARAAWRRGVWPGTSSPAGDWLVARMQRLDQLRHKLAVADRLWREGGEERLTVTLQAILQVREHLAPGAEPAAPLAATRTIDEAPARIEALRDTEADTVARNVAVSR